MKIGRLALPLAAAFGVWPLGSALANPRDVPLGGRTAMMGGACTASGNDAAMPFLNPAGLALVPRDVLSLSASVYGVTNREIPTLFYPNGWDFDAAIDQERFQSHSVLQLPSSIMYALPLSAPSEQVRHTLALSLVIPTAEVNNYSATLAARIPSLSGAQNETRSVSQTIVEYDIGATYAVAIGRVLRLGLSVFGVYAVGHNTATESFVFLMRSGSSIYHLTSNNYSGSKSFGLTAVLGAQLSLGEWSFGVGMAAPTLRLAGVVDVSNTMTISTPDGRSWRSDSTLTSGTYREGRPLRLNAGVSWEVPKKFAFAADVLVFTALGSGQHFEGVWHTTTQVTNEIARDWRRPNPYQWEEDWVLDVSIGGEVWLSETLALRAGGFTNLSTFLFPEGPLTPYVNNFSIDRAGASLGLGILTGSFDTTIGAVYQRGWGSMVTWTTKHDEGVAVGVDEDTLMLIISGAVTLEDLL